MPENKGQLEIWRGEALSAWNAGISGIYTFNRFDPNDIIFRELGDPELLKRLNHVKSEIFLGNNLPDYWLKSGSDFLTES